MIQGKVNLSLDLASFSLIFEYSSKVSCLAFLETGVLFFILLVVYH